MALFRRSKPADRDAVLDWAARQYTMRAQSLEAQQLIHTSTTQADWTPERVMWKFLETQWPIVVEETARRFKDRTLVDLLTDVAAMERALRQAAPTMFPLTHEVPTDDVVARLREVGRIEGWQLG